MEKNKLLKIFADDLIKNIYFFSLMLLKNYQNQELPIKASEIADVIISVGGQDTIVQKLVFIPHTETFGLVFLLGSKKYVVFKLGERGGYDFYQDYFNLHEALTRYIKIISAAWLYLVPEENELTKKETDYISEFLTNIQPYGNIEKYKLNGFNYSLQTILQYFNEYPTVALSLCANMRSQTFDELPDNIYLFLENKNDQFEIFEKKKNLKIDIDQYSSLNEGIKSFLLRFFKYNKIEFLS